MWHERPLTYMDRQNHDCLCPTDVDDPVNTYSNAGTGSHVIRMVDAGSALSDGLARIQYHE